MRLIDADAFKKYIEDGIDGLILPRDQVEKAIAITKGFLKDIDEQPTVERPHGEWIKERLQIDERHFRSFAKCKVCGCEFKPYSFAVKEFDFCPKCGSDNRKREGEKNESDHL